MPRIHVLSSRHAGPGTAGAHLAYAELSRTGNTALPTAAAGWPRAGGANTSGACNTGARGGGAPTPRRRRQFHYVQ